MKIDIDGLSEAELVALNRKIVARLRLLHQMHAHVKMLEFKIGDRITFQPDSRPPQTGMITRYNKKTVTVITDDGQRWNISPGFLRMAASPAKGSPGENNVIPLRLK